MKHFDPSVLSNVYIPSPTSHKGQNGKILLVGGSRLFHAASLWALEIASRLVDMVFYASVPENNRIIADVKTSFRNGIVIDRKYLADYAKEADCILIGPGMVRSEMNHIEKKMGSLDEINALSVEGEQTYFLTHYLLTNFPHKKFVLDAGALQMMEKEWLLGLNQMPILTPHQGEFNTLFDLVATPEHISDMAKIYQAVILTKEHEDIVCSPEECIVVTGGNAGMTKGGTGDVLAGLTASLYAKNDAFLSATAASYFNKRAGDSLFEKVGYYFNASDLVLEIPQIMKKYLIG